VKRWISVYFSRWKGLLKAGLRPAFPGGRRPPGSVNFHRLSLGIGLAILALSLSGCSGQPGTLSGTVTQVEDGKPVVGAEIRVFELKKAQEVTTLDIYEKTNTVYRQVTDANGAFSASLQPARYLVEVWIGGARVTSRMVQIKAGRTLGVEFQIVTPAP